MQSAFSAPRRCLPSAANRLGRKEVKSVSATAWFLWTVPFLVLLALYLIYFFTGWPDTKDYQ